MLTIRGLPARKVNEVIMELGVLMEQEVRHGESPLLHSKFQPNVPAGNVSIFSFTPSAPDVPSPIKHCEILWISGAETAVG